MKAAMLLAAALLSTAPADVRAAGDKASYNQRAAHTDMALFRELDRAGKGFLARDDVRGDLLLGTRFDDIDTNRDGIVTPREMRDYIEKTYGAPPTPG